MIVLGLDISSSTIGWAALKSDCGGVSLHDYGHIKPPGSKKGSLVFRLNGAYDDMRSLFLKINPDVVAIEAYANKFPRGRSSAHTIIILSTFNEAISLCCYRAIGIEPEKYTVSSIRSSLSKFYNEKIASKDDVFMLMSKKFDSFNVIQNRNGLPRKECYDESDAMAVALTNLIKEGFYV